METQGFLSVVRVQGHPRVTEGWAILPKPAHSIQGAAIWAQRVWSSAWAWFLPSASLAHWYPAAQSRVCRCSSSEPRLLPQRQKNSPYSANGQWQSLETETLLKPLSNGCEREMLLCTMNIFVPIKIFAVSKQGKESEIHSQILEYLGLMSIAYTYFFL